MADGGAMVATMSYQLQAMSFTAMDYYSAHRHNYLESVSIYSGHNRYNRNHHSVLVPENE